MDKYRIGRAALILLVLLTSVGIAASTILGAHQHESSARNCGVCLAGHLPWSGPAAQTIAALPISQEWRQIIERPVLVLEAEQHRTPSRAPPAL